MQRAFESPPTQLTVNQAAGIAVNAAAAAAAHILVAKDSRQQCSVWDVQIDRAAVAEGLVWLTVDMHARTRKSHCPDVQALTDYPTSKRTHFSLCYKQMLSSTSYCESRPTGRAHTQHHPHCSRHTMSVDRGHTSMHRLQAR
jgi:hypothetical protein